MDAVVLAFKRLARKLGITTELSDAEVRGWLREMLKANARGRATTQNEGRGLAMPSVRRGQAANAAADSINRRQWWHVPPAEGASAYQKRGKFYTSSFAEAEFYGRPNDAAERVSVANPLVGDEAEIARVLGVPAQTAGMGLKEIAAHDEKWAKAARAQGYDAIAVLTPAGYAEYQQTGKMPRSVELNTLGQREPMASPRNLLDRLERGNPYVSVLGKVDNPFIYGGGNKFFISPSGEWVSVDDHQNGARQILKENGLGLATRQQIDREANADQATLQQKHGFVRVIDDGARIYVTNERINNQQMRVLKDVAIETGKSLVWDTGSREVTLYDPSEDGNTSGNILRFERDPNLTLARIGVSEETAKRVVATVAKTLGVDPGKLRVIVRQSAETDDPRAAAWEGYYFREEGAVIHADQVGVREGETGEQAVARLFLHEVMAHYGIDLVRQQADRGDATAKRVMARLAELGQTIRPADLSAVAAHWQLKGWQEVGSRDWWAAVEEYVATVAGETAGKPLVQGKASLAQQWLDAIRDWLAVVYRNVRAALGIRASAAQVDRDLKSMLTTVLRASQARLQAGERQAPAGATVVTPGIGFEDMADQGELLASKQARAEVFYSALTKTIEGLQQERFSPQQLKGMLAGKPGVKADELKWTGFNTWLDEKSAAGKPVTKAEALAFLRENQVKVTVTDRSDAKPMTQPALVWKSDKYGIETTDVTGRVWELVKNGDQWQIATDGNLVNQYKSYSLEEAKAAVQEMAGEEAKAEPTTKFGRYMKNVPTDEGYGEAVFNLPSKNTEPFAVLPLNDKLYHVVDSRTNESVTRGLSWQSAADVAVDKNAALQTQFRVPSAHQYGDFSDVNQVARVIYADMTVPGVGTGKVGLEMQGDWSIEARRGNINDEEYKRLEVLSATNQNRTLTPEEQREYTALRNKNTVHIPDAPLIHKHYELSLKWLIRQAVEEGKDFVGWNAGSVVAERYDLSKEVKEVRAFDRGNETWDLSSRTYDWKLHDIATRIPTAKLSEYVGKDLADKIVKGEGQRDEGAGKWQIFSGLQLKVGGKWAETLYDKMLVDYAKKYVKQWGGEVESANVVRQKPFNDTTDEFRDRFTVSQMGDGKWAILDHDSGEIVEDGYDDKAEAERDLKAKIGYDTLPIWLVRITPQMKAAVLTQGQPLFSVRRGTLAPQNAAQPADEGMPPRQEPEGDTFDLFTVKGKDHGSLPVTLGGMSKVNPIALPELYELAKSVGFSVSLTSRLRRYLGYFSGGFGGEIAISDKIRDPRVLAQVLAHEIGHGADWLDDKTLKRGNLIGRLLSMVTTYTKNKFPAEYLNAPTKKELRRELIALSAWWTPWNREQASDHYRQYRDSAKELYAEFLSVLLNAPAEAEQRAPLFYKAWFESLSQKPRVTAQFVRLQELISNPLALGEHRADRITQMFADAEAEARRLHQVAKAGETNLWFLLKDGLLDKNAAGLAVRNKLWETGAINRDTDLRYAFEENDLLPIFVQGALRKLQPLWQDIKTAGLQDTVSKILFLERIAAGDRWEFANPLGYTPATADQQMQFMQKQDPAGYAQARGFVDRFHDWVYAEGTALMAEDILTPEQAAKTKNTAQTYATFRVTRYMRDWVSAGMIGQQGTLSDIGDPLTATVMKVASMVRAAKRNAIKKEVANTLLANAAELDVERATVVQVPGKEPFVKPHRNPDMVPVLWREAGKWQAMYVDKYTADTLNKASATELNGIGNALRLLTGNPVFRQFYITLNLGFQSANLFRDALAAWKAHPDMTFGKLAKQYLSPSTWRTAASRVKGEYEPTIAAMEQAGALNVTLNELIRTEREDDREVEAFMRRFGIGQHEYRPQWHGIPGVKQALSLLGAIEFAGNVIETVPKVAGWNTLRTGTDRERAFRVRNYVGTPNPKRRGRWYATTNNVFLFSNIGMQGLRRDMQLATDPKTRAGWWLKTIAIGILPKLAMAAATYGLMGDDDQDEINGVSEYMKANYTVIPLGRTATGETVALSLPTDESTRLVAGVFWKLLTKAPRPKELVADSFKFVTSHLPFLSGPAPGFTIAGNWMKYLTGGVPRDNFRDQPVLTEDELKAGGWHALAPMLWWTASQNGIVNLDIRDGIRPDKPLWEKSVALTPALNRFLRVTSYGHKERATMAAQRAEAVDAAERLERKEALRDGLAAGRSTTEIALEQADDRQEARRLLRSFDAQAQRRNPDIWVQTVGRLATINQQLAAIEELGGKLTDDQYQDKLVELHRQKVIGPGVVKAALRRRLALAQR
jgi:hypothetical protein